MSLTSQLHELIKFLAPLVAEDEEDTPHEPTTDEDTWQAVAGHLLSAADDLERAKAQLGAAAGAAQKGSTQARRFATCAESASDRWQWVTELHHRALVYSDRAHVEIAADGTRGARSEPERQARWEAARSDLNAAQRAIERARRKLGAPNERDVLALAFIQDLDLEAEMILVLRRRLEGVPSHG